MDITIHWTFSNDVGYGEMRRLTVGPKNQPGASIVLEPPAADPDLTDDERGTVAAMMGKGNGGRLPRLRRRPRTRHTREAGQIEPGGADGDSDGGPALRMERR